MTKPEYNRPPITEALIEIRFSSIIEESKLKKLIKKFEKYYPNLRPIESRHYELNVENTISPKAIETTFRLSSQDMSQIVVLRKSAFLLSQLAPYKSWEDLISRFERDWKLYKKHVGHHQIERIGVRYINRIDIPKSGSLIHENEYLNIYPKQPESLSPFLNYAIQTQSQLEDIGSVLTINSAVVQSPVPECMSIVVDQDIAREIEPPQSTEGLISFLNEVRTKKNSVFESCITDKSRELFNK